MVKTILGLIFQLLIQIFPQFDHALTLLSILLVYQHSDYLSKCAQSLLKGKMFMIIDIIALKNTFDSGGVVNLGHENVHILKLDCINKVYSSLWFEDQIEIRKQLDIL